MAEDDSLIREVNEEMRNDRLRAFWNSIKIPIYIAAGALIIITAGTSIWKQYQQSQAEKNTSDLADAQALYGAQHYDEAAKAFATLTKKTRSELADAVKLWQARALLGAKKEKPALRVLQNIVLAPEGKDLFWRDIACLHLMGLVKTTGEIPSSCHGEKTSALSPVLKQFYAAGLWQSGDEKTARALLESLAEDTRLPPDVRAEARAFDLTIAHKE